MNQHAEHVKRYFTTLANSCFSSNLMGLKVSIMLKPPKVITNYKRAHSAWNPSEKIVLQDRPKKYKPFLCPEFMGILCIFLEKTLKGGDFL